MRKSDQAGYKTRAAADVILRCGLIGSLLALAYCLYHYGLSEDRRFATETGFLAYYALPAVVAVFLLAALRLKPGHKIRVAFFGLAVGD